MRYAYFRHYKRDTLAVTNAPIPRVGVSVTPTRQGTAVNIPSSIIKALAGFSGDAVNWDRVDREKAKELAEACGVTLEDLEENVPKDTQHPSE